MYIDIYIAATIYIDIHMYSSHEDVGLIHEHGVEVTLAFRCSTPKYPAENVHHRSVPSPDTLSQ